MMDFSIVTNKYVEVFYEIISRLVNELKMRPDFYKAKREPTKLGTVKAFAAIFKMVPPRLCISVVGGHRCFEAPPGFFHSQTPEAMFLCWV